MTQNLPTDNDSQNLPQANTDDSQPSLPQQVKEPTLRWSRVVEKWEEYKKSAISA